MNGPHVIILHIYELYLANDKPLRKSTRGQTAYSLAQSPLIMYMMQYIILIDIMLSEQLCLT